MSYRERQLAKIHSSHDFMEERIEILAPAGTPRFYGVRECKNCGGWVAEHPAGLFIDDELFEPCVNTQQQAKPDFRLETNFAAPENWEIIYLEQQAEDIVAGALEGVDYDRNTDQQQAEPDRYQIAREVVQEWARLSGLPLFERSVAIVIEKYCVQQMVDQQQAEEEE